MTENAETTENTETAENKSKPPLLPLADPVVNATFPNKELAGLAAESLIKAILRGCEDDELPKIGEIISVTPQGYHGRPYERGCRVDVEVRTDANERLIIEVQLGADMSIMQRNLFSASRIITETSKPGDTSFEMAARMPRIIVINLLEYNIREDNKELFQPVKAVFLKEPQRVAIEQFAVYNVQLPRLDEMEPKFEEDWYCWLYALHTAHKEKRELGEVIEMTAELQDFKVQNEGFRQYCERYGQAVADIATRQEYYDWYESWLREEGMKQTAIDIGRREGLERGLSRGRQEGRLEGRQEGLDEGLERGLAQGRVSVAITMLKDGMDINIVAKLTGLPIADVRALLSEI